MPQRIQRQRTRGRRMPTNTVYVGRPSRCGNPFRVSPVAGETAVDPYRRWLTCTASGQRLLAEARRDLAGRNLACWCPPGQACHADILLTLANATGETR
jgi:hypothetical protein